MRVPADLLPKAWVVHFHWRSIYPLHCDKQSLRLPYSRVWTGACKEALG